MIKKIAALALFLSRSVLFVDGPSTVGAAVVLQHQEFVILTVEHLHGEKDDTRHQPCVSAGV